MTVQTDARVEEHTVSIAGLTLTTRSGPYAVFAAGVVFSFGPLLFRSRQEATEWQFLFYRSISLAFAAAVVLLVRHRRGLPGVMRSITTRHWIAGVLLALMFSGFIISLSRVDTATVLLLQTLSPFSAALLGWILIKERVSTSTWGAMALAITGVVIMVGVGRPDPNAVGLIAAGLIPLMLGVYAVLLRTSTAQDPAVPIVIAGCVGSAIALVATVGRDGIDVPWGDVVLGCVSGGVLLGVGLPFFNAASQVVPAAPATLLLLGEIVLAPFWVWMWQDEELTVGTVVGGSIILVALVWLLSATEARRGLAATTAIRIAAWRANRPRVKP